MKRKKTQRYIFRAGFARAFEKIDAYDVEIVPWMATFIAKRDGGWTVFEVTTGKNIRGGKTIERAIESAREYIAQVIAKVGEEGAKKMIENYPKVPNE